MSYERDKDAHTRGVMAIAAVDGANQRLRAVERAKAVRMQRMDRALAEVARRGRRPLGRRSLAGVPTYGGGGPGASYPGNRMFGGYEAIGMVNLDTQITPDTGGGTGTPPRPPRPPTPPGSRAPRTPGVLAMPPRAGSGGSGGLGTQTTPPTNTLNPPGLPGSLPPPPPLPPDVSFPPTPPAPPPPVVSTGGGGGVFNPPPPPPPAAVVDEGLLDVIQQPTDLPTDAVEPPAKKKPNYLLYAGLALGAYLLLREKES